MLSKGKGKLANSSKQTNHCQVGKPGSFIQNLVLSSSFERGEKYVLHTFTHLTHLMNKHDKQAYDIFMNTIQRRNPGEEEFIQAVDEVAQVVIPFTERAEYSHYRDHKMLARIAEPERVIIFRVPWVDDNSEIHVNRGYRIQMSSAIGPYKGGLRFHPSVNLSIFKFLAFEQIFKNSLTTLPLGAGKGGANFDPKGRSEGEIMRFCQSFMAELSKYIGPDTDIPAGDIGVGPREIGYLFGHYKRITNTFSGVLTGKGLSYGGSLIRPEATGYGSVYFSECVLQHKDEGLEGRTCVVSGSGNVAQYTVEKLLEMNAKVVTLSDSGGFIHDPEGINREKLDFVMHLKNDRRGRISAYVDEFSGATYHEGETPWNVPCDLAYPSATQNELHQEDAKALVKNGCQGVFEGANMPCTPEAINVFEEHQISYAPGKACNAGGVATSGLEMSQNSVRLNWTREEVDEKLKGIMGDIHDQCLQYGQDDKNPKQVNYVKGSNIAGFVKVADAMIAQGAV